MDVDPSDIQAILQGAGHGASVTRVVVSAVGAIRNVAGSKVIAAHFGPDGRRIDGSEKVIVATMKSNMDGVWWYRVEPVEDYVFMRFALQESAVGELTDAAGRGVDWWRYVTRAHANAAALPIVDEAGKPLVRRNLPVEFIVVGYRPKALLDYFMAETR
jgi:hypothetical protein